MPERYRRHLPLVIIIVITCLLAGGIYSFARTPVYEATTYVLVDSLDPTSVDPGVEMTSEEIATQDQVMGSEAVAEAVVKELQLEDSATALLRDLTVEQVGEARVLRATVRRENPEEAAAIANAFAESYLGYRQERQEERLESLRAGASDAQAVPGGRIITRASVDDSPAGASPLAVTALSGLVGVLIAGAVAVALDRRLTRRPTGRQDESLPD